MSESNQQKRELPADEPCYLCGEIYPYPVGHHHGEAECKANVEAIVGCKTCGILHCDHKTTRSWRSHCDACHDAGEVSQ